MTPKDFLAELAKLRDQAERAERRVNEAAEAERQAERAAEDAAAELDRADSDPHKAERAKAELDLANDAAEKATRARERAETALRGARRALAEHESEVRKVFDNGLVALRAEAHAELSRLAEEWRAAAELFAWVAAKAAALERAAGSSINVYSPLPYVSAETFRPLGDGVDRSLEALKVPILGRGGHDSFDRICDASHARQDALKVQDFAALAERHAAVTVLAREVSDITKRQRDQAQAAAE